MGIYIDIINFYNHKIYFLAKTDLNFLYINDLQMINNESDTALCSIYHRLVYLGRIQLTMWYRHFLYLYYITQRINGTTIILDLS